MVAVFSLTIMGPLLFLIYLNDSPNINKILNFYLFADDTNIYYESNSLHDLELTVNKELYITNIDKDQFHPYNKPLKSIKSYR